MIHTLHAEMKTVLTVANTQELKTEKLPDNTSLCLQHVCAVDFGKTNARVRVGFQTGQQIMWVTEITCATAGTYYSQDFNVYFKACRNLVFRWTRADVGDRVEVYAYGYYRD